jgi:RNA polymerase sigma factor (sigma-70 family)
MTDELELLRKYVENASEEAFAEVVSRHIRMVYAAARRHVRNAHEAEEITQAVFIILARKAGQLPRGTVLSGWLFRTTRLTACNHIRNETRRRNREREATMQSNLEQEPNDDIWRRVSPLLDGALASLGLKDHNAVVLRYVEGRELAEVGQKMGTTELAARQRIHRAVEKLRKFFAKRGVVLTGAILAGSIAANAAPAAPAGLTASIAAAGALKGATAGASTVALFEGTLKALAWAKLKMAAAIGAGVALAIGTAIVAITYAAEASHTLNKAPTLSPNSPFVRYISNPPWIKKMEYGRGIYTRGPEILNSNGASQDPIWTVTTNTFAVQPSGMYFTINSSSAGTRLITGVDDKFSWVAMEGPKVLRISPLVPDRGHWLPLVEGGKTQLEESRHFGLRPLRPGTFAMHEDGTFTATTVKDEALEGKILAVSNDRPLALTYHVPGQPSLDFETEVTVNITYQYSSATAPLPASYGYSEIVRSRNRGNYGIAATREQPWSAISPFTNYILNVEYGLDESITRGYSASMFLLDVGQYQTNVVSNGVVYVNGVAQPPRGAPVFIQGVGWTNPPAK